MKIQYTSNLTPSQITVEGKNRHDCFNKLWDILSKEDFQMYFFPAKSKVIEK